MKNAGTSSTLHAHRSLNSMTISVFGIMKRTTLPILLLSITGTTHNISSNSTNLSNTFYQIAVLHTPAPSHHNSQIFLSNVLYPLQVNDVAAVAVGGGRCGGADREDEKMRGTTGGGVVAGCYAG